MDMDVVEAELTGLGGEVDGEKRGREKATRITSQGLAQELRGWWAFHWEREGWRRLSRWRRG